MYYLIERLIIMLTRKHYIQFAKVVSELQSNILNDKSIQRGDEYQQAYRYSLELQDNLINIFKKDNPRFDKNKFNDAILKLNGQYNNEPSYDYSHRP